MYRRIVILLVLLLAAFSLPAAAAPPPPQVEAEAAVLLVAKTRTVLFGKKETMYMYPASTTKIMTALVALEAGSPGDRVAVSRLAAACEGTSLELRCGDIIALQDLLYGMLLVSGNDAATAIAEHIAGSVPEFAALMNAKADQVGAKNTHFSNPHGLPDPINHYTTAYDLALITAHGLQNPEFARLVCTPEHTVRFISRGKSRTVTLRNTNLLLKSYRGANGVKTGFTNDAGECLVASARRDGVQLIAVILNSEDRWRDAEKLLDYGFNSINVKPGL